MSKLTNSQIYTLRRMYTGQVYLALDDGKRGVERRGVGYEINDVSSPSVPVLIRKGYVEFKTEHREKGRWYYVQLTDIGRFAAKTYQVRS